MNQKKNDEFNEHKEILNRKIKAFQSNINRLGKNRSINHYFEVKKSYDQLKDTISDMVKMIFLFEIEVESESLYKSIIENLELSFDDEPEESKENGDQSQPTDRIYDKPINFLVAKYLSSNKVKQLQNHIQKLCKDIEEYYSNLKEKRRGRNLT